MTMDQEDRHDAPTDRSLVLLTRQGDGRAFRLLTERYTPLVASALHHRLSDQRDVEDEIQETFLSAYRGIDALDDPERFSGWVARIAVNRAHTRMRQLARQREIPSGTREMLDQVGRHDVWTWQYGLSWLLGREALRSAVDRLPGDCRDPVLLWAVEGYSLVEVGDRLGVSEKVASRRIRRGCRQICTGAEAAA
ncbi:sigma-70 family RNA polymerase sigma factor [Candidatus Poribacteria bacterium]|jgi:RNA polymerase sigma factor CnrH|nr:sigma-70 family RNA polymerase sigma factor [Candidatus Poribacteria bacterium]MBT7806050.1 sigma-70 family RNA polymerase sigma factor [Candidatus Poribacteria bacterium]